MQSLELRSQRTKIAWKHAQGRNQKQMKLWLTRSDLTKVGVLSVLAGVAETVGPRAGEGTAWEVLPCAIAKSGANFNRRAAD
jgi:hypothetical protein